MSFKEDFFEALRSVKRDFFRDSEYDASRPEQAPPQQDPPAFTAAPAEPGEPVQAAPTYGSQEPLPPATEPPITKESSASIIGDTGDFRMPDNIYTPDDEPVSPPPKPDDEVFDAFQQASAIRDDEPEDDESLDDTYDDVADEFREVHSSFADNEAPPYRDYQPNYPDIAVQPESMDNRKIYDFDPDDFYSDDKTVISRNTVIRGALQTEDSLRLLGQILGDIDCKSNIVVAGKIRGNTSAANAYIVDAQVDGNMVCDDAINVNKDAWILGNIRAQQADIDGKIKGNIEIRHTVSIGSASSVIGNISTDELEIKRGAFVNGQIIMYSPSRDVIDRFDDFDRA
ncbi:polymer-forming cytoskeletal protein [Ruminococcaceae bacterium OttesenSCG-928-L11]|nr:polymer-forming cytoskeletal protein [Ruminococcaceae bacterium OttesenSCG-928-L11]